MSKKIIVAVSGIAILAAFVLSIDAYAIPFTGNTWVANHIGTDDYYVVIAPGNTNIARRSVNLRGFELRRSRLNLDFSELTKEKNLLVYVIRNYEEQFRNIVRFRDRDGERYRIRVALSAFNNPASPVPEPSTVLLLGTGLVGLIAYGRKKMKKT
jgi:hypothetical protein